MKFTLLLLHLHTSPFVVAYCMFYCNVNTGRNYEIHSRFPVYVRSNLRPKQLPHSSAGCPRVRLARFTLQNQLLPSSSHAYFHSGVPTAPSKRIFLLLL